MPNSRGSSSTGGRNKGGGNVSQQLKRGRPLLAHPSEEEHALGHDKKKASMKGPLVCAACRKRPQQGITWAETDAKGMAVGERCMQCTQLWSGSFAYLGWDEFCEMNRSEATCLAFAFRRRCGNGEGKDALDKVCT